MSEVIRINPDQNCHAGYSTMPNYMLATHTQGAAYCTKCKTWYHEKPILNGSEWDYRYGRPIRNVLDILFYVYITVVWIFITIILMGVIIL